MSYFAPLQGILPLLESKGHSFDRYLANGVDLTGPDAADFIDHLQEMQSMQTAFNLSMPMRNRVCRNLIKDIG